MIDRLSLAELGNVAFRLAQEHLTFSEPIPDFSSRFPGKLESCLSVPFQRFYGLTPYRSLTAKASILFYLLIKNHPFQNGNKRIAIMALLLGRKIGWEKDRLRSFGVGCLLHDVGKIFVENEVLNKPGRLDEDEFERIKAHPTMGYELIKTIAPALGYLVPHVAFQHHERQDGSGYPRGLTGDNKLGRRRPNVIHDFGSVAAVADIYDAMSSDRPYRAGWPPDRVVGMIRELAGAHVNSRVVEIFLRTVAPYPIGTCIQVLNGEYEGYEGVVADVDERVLDRPKIRLLFDSAGDRMDAVEIDLRVEGDVMVKSVREGEPSVESAGSSGQGAASAKGGGA